MAGFKGWTEVLKELMLEIEEIVTPSSAVALQ